MHTSTSTRSGGNVPALPGATPRPRPTALSRRNAIGAAAAIALSLTSINAASAGALARPVVIAASASPDVDLITFADRLVTLATRCEAVADHRATIEDRVFLSCPRPEPFQKPAGNRPSPETATVTETVFTIERSHEPEPARVRWEEATAATTAAHEKQQRAEETRLGLPEVARRHDRMMRRCDRWAADLAAMKPLTVEGLGAKASAMMLLAGKDRMSHEIEVARYAALVMSVLADAVRLGATGSA